MGEEVKGGKLSRERVLKVRQNEEKRIAMPEKEGKKGEGERFGLKQRL